MKKKGIILKIQYCWDVMLCPLVNASDVSEKIVANL
jgi:hypothetical protein